MLRTIFILGLAAAAMADSAVPMQQIVRIGSVGTSFTNIKGILMPTTPTLGKTVPAYEFKNMVDGAPAVETDKIFFRCSMLSNFFVPHAVNPKPVLLCRNDGFEKSVVGEMSHEKMAFLFSAEDLTIPSGITEIELVIGRGMWKTLMATHDSSFVTMGTMRSIRKEGHYDGYKIVRSSHPYDTMLIYDVPASRVRRQFGGGFSGSGAQAGASSFGGGGGFGGFPGSGFGGGFSGSAAMAGSSSFGGGGGGFFG